MNIITIKLGGYEEMARAHVDDGDVVLVHNNSTHYLVVHVPDNGLDENTGYELVSVPYYNAHNVGRALQEALNAFTLEVLERTHFDDPDACPGCGCGPGDGRTAGCSHPDGCGYWESLGEPSACPRS